MLEDQHVNGVSFQRNIFDWFFVYYATTHQHVAQFSLRATNRILKPSQYRKHCKSKIIPVMLYQSNMSFKIANQFLEMRLRFNNSKHDIPVSFYLVLVLCSMYDESMLFSCLQNDEINVNLRPTGLTRIIQNYKLKS